MTKHLDIKMATVMEEEFDNEEYNQRVVSFFNDEELTEMSFKERCEEEDTLSDDDTPGEDNNERRTSLVEKDVEDGLQKEVIEAILRPKLPELDEIFVPNNETTISPQPANATPPKKPTNATRSSRLSKTNLSPTTSKSFTLPMPTKKPNASSFSKAKNKSFTLTVKDKFVTELSFYHPFSFLKSKMVNLGVFLSTSRAYGDHFVYKISPLSPFKSLNLQPQDKIIGINHFNISGWPHNTVVNFVRHLSHNDQSRFDSPNAVYKFTFSIEFIPANRPSLSPGISPGSLLASLEVIMMANGRTSIGASSVTPTRFEYQNETRCKHLKMSGDSGHYLKVEETGAVSGSSVGDQNNEESPLRIVIGEKFFGDATAEIKFHKFNMVPLTAGEVVALETHRQGTFLHAGNAAHGSSLSLIALTNPTDIRNVNSVDSKLFRILSDDGDERIKIENIQSGLFLKAEEDTVSLVQQPLNTRFPESMLFYDFDC